MSGSTGDQESVSRPGVHRPNGSSSHSRLRMAVAGWVLVALMIAPALTGPARADATQAQASTKKTAKQMKRSIRRSKCSARSRKQSAKRRRACRTDKGHREVAKGPDTPARAPTEVPTPPRPFSATSFWNTPLKANSRLDSRSDTYVGEVRRQLIKSLPWINTTKYSSPVYTVPAGQRTVRVKLDYAYAPALQAALERVPIPAGARPAAGADKTMVVWQPSTDTMWELWLTKRHTDGWHARWGGRMPNVSSNPGYFHEPRNWGATATSLPMLGGLIRLDEMKAGVIDHALAICLPETRAGWHSWPAQRTDGNVDQRDAVPEGTRFRLDPDLDLGKIHMARTTRMIAVAAQKYGMVVRDKGGAVSFYAEDPTPAAANPFAGANGYFRGRYPSQLLEQFPWSHMQALQGSLSRG